VKPRGILGTIVLLFLAGCGEQSGGTVRGKVTYKGKPVILGGVSFIIDGSLPKYAAIQKDGSYEAVGVPVGKTTVLVISLPTPEGDRIGDFAHPEIIAKKRAAAVKAAREAGWFPIPTAYGDVQKSPLRFSVEKGDNLNNIDLK
jgi:hypothetical protein